MHTKDNLDVLTRIRAAVANEATRRWREQEIERIARRVLSEREGAL